MDTLATLLEQAEMHRNAALAAFNQARARRDETRAQTQDLQTYRDDYSARWTREFQRGAALEVMRSYHQFSARLDLAIAQQTQAATICQQAFERANEMLSAHELRVASVRKLIERRRLELRQAGERREQHANDEAAQRAAARRAAIERMTP